MIVFWVWRREAPLAWMAREGYVQGWRPWEKYRLPAVWLTPILVPVVAKKLGCPLEPLILAIFLFLVVRRVPPPPDPELRSARGDS